MKGKGKKKKYKAGFCPDLKFIAYKAKSRLSHLSGNLWTNFLLKVYRERGHLVSMRKRASCEQWVRMRLQNILEPWPHTAETRPFTRSRVSCSTAAYPADYCWLLPASFLDDEILSISHSLFICTGRIPAEVIISAVIWMSVSSQNSYVENLVPSVMVFKRWGLWKVIRSWGHSPQGWALVPLQETHRTRSHLPLQGNAAKSQRSATCKRSITRAWPHWCPWTPASGTVRSTFLCL